MTGLVFAHNGLSRARFHEAKLGLSGQLKQLGAAQSLKQRKLLKTVV
jgi:hypothetical protein